MRTTILRPRTLLAVSLLLMGLAASSARRAAADNIDHELLAQMPKLIEACRSKGYSRVGVLTFLYQDGNRPSRFGGATICSNMPSRVENALVLKLSSKQPELIVLPRAAESAVRAIPHASYRTPAGRQRLLDLPLAPLWGDAAKVTADAFIIGKVQPSPDRRRVTVSLGAFDRQSMFDILEFEVKADRNVLADIGQGFSLAKRRVRGVSDDAILDGVESDLETTAEVNRTGTTPQSAGFPVELTVSYDQQPQAMRDDPAADGSYNYSLPEPQEGQSLTFGLRNVTDQPVGVALLVNGTSTLYLQEGEPADLTKWVLEPGKDYRIKGYHQQGNEKYFEITTLSEEESRQRYDDLGGAKFAGLIHLHVFQKQTAADETPSFTRSIGRLPRQTQRFRTLHDAQQAVARKSNIYPPGTRPLAGWGREQFQTLAEMELGPVTLTSTLIVRYSSSAP